MILLTEGRQWLPNAVAPRGNAKRKCRGWGCPGWVHIEGLLPSSCTWTDVITTALLKARNFLLFAQTERTTSNGTKDQTIIVKEAASRLLLPPLLWGLGDKPRLGSLQWGLLHRVPSTLEFWQHLGCLQYHESLAITSLRRLQASWQITIQFRHGKEAFMIVSACTCRSLIVNRLPKLRWQAADAWSGGSGNEFY